MIADSFSGTAIAAGFLLLVEGIIFWAMGSGNNPRWKLNNQDSFAVTGIGSKYRLQGAIAALICLFASEQHGGREKIKLL